MDKLAEALAQAIHAGATVAPEILRWYFLYRIVSDVVSYLLPCSAIVCVAVLLARTIRHYNGLNYECRIRTGKNIQGWPVDKPTDLA